MGLRADGPPVWVLASVVRSDNADALRAWIMREAERRGYVVVGEIREGA